jgi:hypothetical protein
MGWSFPRYIDGDDLIGLDIPNLLPGHLHSFLFTNGGLTDPRGDGPVQLLVH